MRYTVPAEPGKYIYCLPIQTPSSSVRSMLNPPGEGIWVELDWAYPKASDYFVAHLTTHTTDHTMGHAAERIELQFKTDMQNWKQFCPLELTDPGSDTRPAVVNLIGEPEHEVELTSRYVKNLCREWLAAWIYYLGSSGEHDTLFRCSGIAKMTETDPDRDHFGRPINHIAWDIWRNGIYRAYHRLPVCSLSDERWNPFQGVFMNTEHLTVQEHGARTRLEHIGFLPKVREFMETTGMSQYTTMQRIAALALVYSEQYYELIDDMVTLHMMPCRPRFLWDITSDYSSGIVELFRNVVRAAGKVTPITVFAQKSQSGLMAACQKLTAALGRVVQPDEVRMNLSEAAQSILQVTPVQIQSVPRSAEASKDPDDVLVGVGILEVRRPDFEEAEKALKKFDNRRKSRAQTQFEKGIQHANQSTTES